MSPRKMLLLLLWANMCGSIFVYSKYKVVIIAVIVTITVSLQVRKSQNFKDTYKYQY